nr:Dabb family protein [Rhodococcus rhodochrous]
MTRYRRAFPRSSSFVTAGTSPSSPGIGDYAISAIFEDVPAFRAYLSHPDHVRLVEEFISVMSESYSSIQFEFA